jgi:hypothetical protein
VVGAAVVLIAGPAGAASTPRLAGTWSTKQVVTQSQNGETVGHTTVKPYKFVPQCSTGACATVMTRVHGDGSKQTYVINPNKNSTYTGGATYLGSCYSSNGGVLIAKGYKYTETLTIHVTKTSAGSASAFTGILTLGFTPTAAGKSKCPQGSEIVSLTSGKKTG